MTSPSPELLFSLGIPLGTLLVVLLLSLFFLLPLLLSFLLLSLLVLLSLSPVSPPPSLPSLFSSIFCGLGVRQLGSCQAIPVKLFSCKGLRSHLRHGAPDRSKARNPALIAPVLAFGPNLCDVWVVRGGGGGISTDPVSSLGNC